MKKVFSRTFSLDEQIEFGLFSGDINPIHILPEVARRTIYGECLVHGMHALLWALECWDLHTCKTIMEIAAKFNKPMRLNCVTFCELDEDQSKIKIIQNSRVCVSVNLALGDTNINKFLKDKIPIRDKPINKEFNQLDVGNQFDFKLFGNDQTNAQNFNRLCLKYGKIFVNEIAGLSQIVGMECPGANSLFGSLKLKIHLKTDNSYYRITKLDERIKFVGINVLGHSIDADLECFFRPKATKNISFERALEIVKQNEFSDVNALIIGGSRGLGECVAKLISAGEGKCMISYMLGKEDAENVSNEILIQGGDCEKIFIDVNNIDELVSVIPKLNINQVYYFASPKILPDADTIIESQTNKYHRIYVTKFEELVKKVLSLVPKISIFYPSTDFINNKPREFSSYVEAKIAGEMLCSNLSIAHNDLNIICSRLPMLHTDQNQSFFENKTALKCNSDVLLPIVRKMCSKVV